MPRRLRAVASGSTWNLRGRDSKPASCGCSVDKKKKITQAIKGRKRLFRGRYFTVISEVFEEKLEGSMPENNLPDVGV
jgi:hypothetical protein